MDFERRFTMLMVCAMWVHVTRDIWWLEIGVPVVAGAWALFTLRREQKERRDRLSR